MNENNLLYEEYTNLEDEIYLKDDEGKYIVDEENRKIANVEAQTKNNIDREISKRMDYNNVKNSMDYIFNGDVSSLYPTAMKGNDLLHVKYPVGCSR